MLHVCLEIIATTDRSTIWKLVYSICILLHVSMYLYSYPSTHGISGLAEGAAWEQFKVRLIITIEWPQRYTPRPWSSVFGDTLGANDRVNLEMHSEIVIERVCRCTWRPWLCEHGGGNRASLEMHLDAVIRRVWRYAHGGHDRANMKAVIERDWRYGLGGHDRANMEAIIERIWRPQSCDLGGSNCASLHKYLDAVDGWRAGCWDSTHQLVNPQPWECYKVTLLFHSHRERADGGRWCKEACQKLTRHSAVNS